MFNRNYFKLFFSPDDATGTIESGKMSIGDMEEFLKDETPTELEEDKEAGSKDLEVGDDEEESDKTKKETKSLEDELEEELEENKEDIPDDEIALPVSRKEILAKYPTLFKDFPHLNTVLYREKAYAEILPTVKDARLAVEKAQTLDNFSEELSQGQTVNILQAVKTENPEAFNRLADNYLSNLKSVDENAYFHILGNVVKSMVVAMHNSADEDNKIAAALLNKFMFNSDKFEPATRLSTKEPGEKDEREAAIEKREQEFRENQLNTHAEGINTKLTNSIRAAIDRNIDPRESMGDYVKSKAIQDCENSLDELIQKDTRFKGIIDKLWEKAAENNFSKESLDRIQSAYWSKAKGLLPEIIRKTRNSALKGLGRKSPDEDRRGPLPVGRPSSGKKESLPTNRGNGSSDKERAKAIPKGTKSIDFLMRD